MKTNKKRGFTLIELLVVIAIIGILSSVVLVSLNSARSKGNDAKIEATVSGTRAGFEIFASGGSYVGATSTTPVKPYLDSLTQMGVTYNTAASSTGYAVAAQLSSDNSKAFCVDSVGNATTTAWSNVSGAGILDAAGCL